ncbi:cupin 2 conserved barrel domain-containing protein, partial [Colletotrichum orchidophilum]
SRPRETIIVLYDYKLKSAEEKSVVSVEVTHPPNETTPQRHAGATVLAHIVEERRVSGMNGNPLKVYEVRLSFMESPGCHPTVRENSSESRAGLITVFILNTEVF